MPQWRIGRRTGSDVIPTERDIGRDEFGFEKYEDYFTSDSSDSSSLSNESVRNEASKLTKQNSIGRRTGVDVLRGKNIRLRKDGTEDYNDYYSEDTSVDSYLSGASSKKTSDANDCDMQDRSCNTSGIVGCDLTSTRIRNFSFAPCLTERLNSNVLSHVDSRGISEGPLKAKRNLTKENSDNEDTFEQTEENVSIKSSSLPLTKLISQIRATNSTTHSLRPSLSKRLVETLKSKKKVNEVSGSEDEFNDVGEMVSSKLGHKNALYTSRYNSSERNNDSILIRTLRSSHRNSSQNIHSSFRTPKDKIELFDEDFEGNKEGEIGKENEIASASFQKKNTTFNSYFKKSFKNMILPQLKSLKHKNTVIEDNVNEVDIEKLKDEIHSDRCTNKNTIYKTKALDISNKNLSNRKITYVPSLSKKISQKSIQVLFNSTPNKNILYVKDITKAKEDVNFKGNENTAAFNHNKNRHSTFQPRCVSNEILLNQESNTAVTLHSSPNRNYQNNDFGLLHSSSNNAMPSSEDYENDKNSVNNIIQKIKASIIARAEILPDSSSKVSNHKKDDDKFGNESEDDIARNVFGNDSADMSRLSLKNTIPSLNKSLKKYQHLNSIVVNYSSKDQSDNNQNTDATIASPISTPKSKKLNSPKRKIHTTSIAEQEANDLEPEDANTPRTKGSKNKHGHDTEAIPLFQNALEPEKVNTPRTKKLKNKHNDAEANAFESEKVNATPTTKISKDKHSHNAEENALEPEGVNTPKNKKSKNKHGIDAEANNTLGPEKVKTQRSKQFKNKFGHDAEATLEPEEVNTPITNKLKNKHNDAEVNAFEPEEFNDTPTKKKSKNKHSHNAEEIGVEPEEVNTPKNKKSKNKRNDSEVNALVSEEVNTARTKETVSKHGHDAEANALKPKEVNTLRKNKSKTKHGNDAQALEPEEVNATPTTKKSKNKHYSDAEANALESEEVHSPRTKKFKTKHGNNAEENALEPEEVNAAPTRKKSKNKHGNDVEANALDPKKVNAPERTNNKSKKLRGNFNVGQLRRSSRDRVQPLAYWRNERRLFAYNFITKKIINLGIEPGTREDDDCIKYLKRREEKRQQAKKEMKHKRAPKTSVVNTETGKEERVVLHMPDCLVKWLPPSADGNSDEAGYSLANTFNSDRMRFGQLRINPNKEKPDQRSGNNSVHLQVLKGQVKVTIHNNEIELKRYDSCLVPRHQVYSVRNVLNSQALLAFCVFEFPFFDYELVHRS